MCVVTDGYIKQPQYYGEGNLGTRHSVSVCALSFTGEALLVHTNFGSLLFVFAVVTLNGTGKKVTGMLAVQLIYFK